jgi:hypothetical protein
MFLGSRARPVLRADNLTAFSVIVQVVVMTAIMIFSSVRIYLRTNLTAHKPIAESARVSGEFI